MTIKLASNYAENKSDAFSKSRSSKTSTSNVVEIDFLTLALEGVPVYSSKISPVYKTRVEKFPNLTNVLYFCK